jgi:hypothetical protein
MRAIGDGPVVLTVSIVPEKLKSISDRYSAVKKAGKTAGERP